MSEKLVPYKNFNIASNLLPFIKYMETVEESREKLNDLTKNWDSLSLLSQLGDAGVNMSKIKNNFSSLSSELINYLGAEILKKTLDEINSKAQVAVDIVIRNLFERTADIGFLATDAKIREFLFKNPTKYTEHYESELSDIKKHFVEYVEKYSVYFDIVLMNIHGDVLANIDKNNVILKSKDSIIKQVLTTSEEFVETYKYHDFLPSHKESLVYSFKVTQDNNPGSKVLGVLSLCFKFEDEMKAIFSNLKNERTKECITLLNKSGRVIATSDKYHIPVDAQLEKVLNDEYKVVTFGGRDYISKSCKTNGYQGFFGLGWYGHVMVPIEHAFTAIGGGNIEIGQGLLLSILQHSEQFPDELKSIPIQAADIQYNLNRAIWNGNVKQSNSKNNNKQFSRALLQEIRNTGEKTKNTIGASMANLTKTMVLGDSRFLADLILDIMDRNLYERANDCRWWALTPDFRKILENEQIGRPEREKISSILAYINDLYTVYTNLFVYDRNGVVIAVSKLSQNHLVGQRLSQEWVEKSLAITDSSQYYVSDFERTSLYDSKHTYIYNAPIRSLENESEVIGGIGIVFDSEEQFKAMIQESLPKQSNGEAKESVFAVLATKEQYIIASNNDEYVTGYFFEIDKKFFELKQGESLSEIIEHKGNYYALGVQCSKGYREYKSDKDDYINDVYGFVFSYISDIEETKVEAASEYILEKDVSIQSNEHSVDIASFYIGSHWLGFHASDVIESIHIDELRSTIKLDKNHHYKGNVIYKDQMIYVVDIQNFINENVDDKAYEEIILIRFGSSDNLIGILVNSLGDIPDVHIERVRPLDKYVVGDGTLIESMVFPMDGDASKKVLSILSVEKISDNLVRPEKTHMIPRKIAVG